VRERDRSGSRDRKAPRRGLLSLALKPIRASVSFMEIFSFSFANICLPLQTTTSPPKPADTTPGPEAGPDPLLEERQPKHEPVRRPKVPNQTERIRKRTGDYAKRIAYQIQRRENQNPQLRQPTKWTWTISARRAG
jgi:hypothetical protein